MTEDEVTGKHAWLVFCAMLTVLALMVGGVILLLHRDQTGQGKVDTMEPCSDPIGQPTLAIVARNHDRTCIDQAGNVGYATFSYDCSDGRSLYWNDTGWGWSDGTWQKHERPDGQKIPPDAETARCG